MFLFLTLILTSCSGSNRDNNMNFQKLNITSNVFKHNSLIPANYTCDGDDVNPPLMISNIPDTAKTLVIIAYDPDANDWVHWIVWNIKVNGTELKINEYSVPGTEGINTFKEHAYRGPCPPSGTHSYVFEVYAIDKELAIRENSTKDDVEEAMQGHIIAKGELIGIYTKERK